MSRGEFNSPPLDGPGEGWGPLPNAVGGRCPICMEEECIEMSTCCHQAIHIACVEAYRATAVRHLAGGIVVPNYVAPCPLCRYQPTPHQLCIANNHRASETPPTTSVPPHISNPMYAGRISLLYNAPPRNAEESETTYIERLVNFIVEHQPVDTRPVNLDLWRVVVRNWTRS